MFLVRCAAASLLVLVAAGFSATGLAQIGEQSGRSQSSLQGSSSTAAQTAASSPSDISGRVVNARTHQPVARALVQLGSRRVLTDHDGIFHFPEVTATSGSFTVTKPGFFPESDAGGSRTISFPPTAGIELGISPEAILSGVVTNAAGESLPELSVIARSSVYDETGHHWRSAGQTRTLSDGSFRLTLPQGAYVLQIRPPGRPAAGVDALQPMWVPASASITEAIHLAPGDQVHLDLRPEVRRTYQVTLTAESGSQRGLPILTARTANGLPISLSATPSRGNPGEFRIVLPNGSYDLVGTTQNQDGRQQAQASVTVAGRDVSGVVLRFSPSPMLPVTVELDTSATSDNSAAGTSGTTVTPPTAQQLGLTFLPVTGPGDLADQAYRPEMRRNQTPAFALPNGTYRLHAQESGPWHLVGASCAGSDLLRQNLVVSQGMGDTEIRVRVSNQTSSLQATLTLAGAPSAGWVYLIATTPSATPIQVFRVGPSGLFSHANLAPGSYRAVALERRTAEDLQNPETLTHFLGSVQSFSVVAGEQHTLTLDVVPNGGIAQ